MNTDDRSEWCPCKMVNPLYCDYGAISDPAFVFGTDKARSDMRLGLMADGLCVGGQGQRGRERSDECKFSPQRQQGRRRARRLVSPSLSYFKERSLKIDSTSGITDETCSLL